MEENIYIYITFVCKQKGGEKKRLKIVEARIEQFSRLDEIELVSIVGKIVTADDFPIH